MEYKKKLSIRLTVAIIYAVAGLAMMVVFNLIGTPNEYLSTLGFALLLIGVVKIRRHFLITKSEDTIRRQEIAETDERNVSIANKAKSAAFILYVIAAGIAVVVLQFLQISEIANVLAMSISALVVFYWISYFIISRRS